MPNAQECFETYGYTFVGDPNAEVHPNVVRLMTEYPPMEQRSAEWFAAREKVISASAIPSVIGDNPYENYQKVLRSKVFGAEFHGNEATQHGVINEPVALDRFVKATGNTVFEFGLLTHPVHKFIAGSPDGVCANGELLEIKTPFRRRIKHEIPIYYLGQVQTCMEVCDSPVCNFVQLETKGLWGEDAPEVFDLVRVERDKEWFAAKLPILAKFWEDVTYYRQHKDELDPCSIDLDMYS